MAQRRAMACCSLRSGTHGSRRQRTHHGDREQGYRHPPRPPQRASAPHDAPGARCPSSILQKIILNINNILNVSAKVSHNSTIIYHSYLLRETPSRRSTAVRARKARRRRCPPCLPQRTSEAARHCPGQHRGTRRRGGRDGRTRWR